VYILTYLLVVVIAHEAPIAIEAVSRLHMVARLHVVFGIVFVVEGLPATFTLPVAHGVSVLPCCVVVDKITLACVAMEFVDHYDGVEVL